MMNRPGERFYLFDDFRVDRKSTRLNSSHDQISYAVFCLKKISKLLAMRDLLYSNVVVRYVVHAHVTVCGSHSLPNHTHISPPITVSSIITSFFFKNRGPPEISSLPQHNPLRI